MVIEKFAPHYLNKAEWCERRHPGMGRELLPPAVDHGGEAALVEVSVVPAVRLALVP